jgi:hypothetical protein
LSAVRVANDARPASWRRGEVGRVTVRCAPSGDVRHASVSVTGMRSYSGTTSLSP